MKATSSNAKRKVNYWILVLSRNDPSNKGRDLWDVFLEIIHRKAWGLRDNGRYVTKLKDGDIALLYVGYPNCVFAGYAKLGSRKLTQKQRRKIGTGRKLTNFKKFKSNVEVNAGLISRLKFVHDEKNWGLYFRGSAVKLFPCDLQTIWREARRINSGLSKRI